MRKEHDDAAQQCEQRTQRHHPWSVDVRSEIRQENAKQYVGPTRQGEQGTCEIQGISAPENATVFLKIVLESTAIVLHCPVASGLLASWAQEKYAR